MDRAVSYAVTEVHTAGSSGAWSDHGFVVVNGAIPLERCAIVCDGDAPALGVTADPNSAVEIPSSWLGVPLVAASFDHGPARHPNAMVGMDHIVIMAPSIIGARAAIADMGWEIRRERSTTMMGTDVVQAFVWAGSTLLEIVCGLAEPTESDRASLWGVSLASSDLDATAAVMGERLGAVKDAVQAGRQIATVRGGTDILGLAVAIMSPHR